MHHSNSYPKLILMSSLISWIFILILMLSSMYFDELDPIRKDIQGDLMGKVDCVMEACRESYDEGLSEGMSKGLSKGLREKSLEIAKNLLARGNFSCDEISEIVGIDLDEIVELKNEISAN